MFEKVNINIDKSFYDLLKTILVYEPKQRIKPLKALTHPFFDALRIKGKVSSNVSKILFSFNAVEKEKDCDGVIQRELVPDWFVED